MLRGARFKSSEPNVFDVSLVILSTQVQSGFDSRVQLEITMHSYLVPFVLRNQLHFIFPNKVFRCIGEYPDNLV